MMPIVTLLSLITMSVPSKAMPPPLTLCINSHATCGEGDSILRLQDLLVEECRGVEPALGGQSPAQGASKGSV